jgi:hypothetical protein
MKRVTWIDVAALTCLGLAFCIGDASSQEGKAAAEGPDPKAVQQERMRRLAMAYELAETGREKKAPEYLIAAAAMLRHLSGIQDMQNMKRFDVKPEITGPAGADADKEIKAPSLREQSDEWFREASDLGAASNVNVDKLIKIAKERETTDKEERSVFGGPRRIAMLIGPGQTHSFNFLLGGLDEAQWAFQSSATLHVSIVRADRKHGLSANGTFFTKVWTSAQQTAPTPILIRITNQKKTPAQYVMTIQ